METVSLRRTKEQLLIGLPSKSICHVELLHEERELYDRMEEEAKQVVRKYINDRNATRNEFLFCNAKCLLTTVFRSFFSC
ncbi:hypothetical protein BVRB_013690 [Beta vulgaris subsp. vulgaris]|uniref:Uncharacterized protein n=1 Tax=Beta vulgaris subsp. vulgaris TaxID=3555 RepID=A0A0J8DVS8_BETVV|nr:hypothetical protein BVRB_013690 [Beta vulgaris subsp. vulgaris]